MMVVDKDKCRRDIEWKYNVNCLLFTMVFLFGMLLLFLSGVFSFVIIAFSMKLGTAGLAVLFFLSVLYCSLVTFVSSLRAIRDAKKEYETGMSNLEKKR